MSKSASFFEAVVARRSYYSLHKESTLSQEQLKELIQKAVKYTPTSFNGQQSRAVLVAGKKHDELWDKVKESHLKTLGGDKDQEELWSKKFDKQFKAGYGTVLFFEDQEIVNGSAAKMPALAQSLSVWSHNSAGMLQYIVWTALEAEGHGASLQHYAQYTPGVQAEITELVDVPPTWSVTALLPFGVPAGPPGSATFEKTFEPIEKRTKFFFDKN
ncbi:uncharacterized protein L203_102472 [Cryptococcus depauperatus CBS 7841]|uniref:Nitroreductase domain-containing protein n=1 Tax=Cryptococcus depauperatus CBS 7841 TaxID=1295531 RepID=A0AAJ8JRV9_9TREE